MLRGGHQRTDSVVAMSLSDFLKPRLTGRNTKSKLARRMKVTPTSVTRWVLGKQMPDFEKSFRLATALKEDPKAIFRAMGRDDWVEFYASLKQEQFLDDHNQRLASIKDPEERELLEKLLDVIRTKTKPGIKNAMVQNVREFWNFLPAEEKEDGLR